LVLHRWCERRSSATLALRKRCLASCRLCDPTGSDGRLRLRGGHRRARPCAMLPANPGGNMPYRAQPPGVPAQYRDSVVVSNIGVGSARRAQLHACWVYAAGCNNLHQWLHATRRKAIVVLGLYVLNSTRQFGQVANPLWAQVRHTRAGGSRLIWRTPTVAGAALTGLCPSTRAPTLPRSLARAVSGLAGCVV
jgi:hypothetical protein